jgi:hypothetical protein
MADRLPEADPILTALIDQCKDPGKIRELVLGYWEAKGIPRGNVSGFEKFASAVAPPQVFSRVVQFPSGARCLIDGATSEAELDAAETELRKTRS